MKMIIVEGASGLEGIMIHQIIRIEQCPSSEGFRTIWLSNGNFILCRDSLEELRNKINGA